MIKSIVAVVPVTRIEATLQVLARVGFKLNWMHDPAGNGIRYASVVDDNGNELHLSESRGDGIGPVVVYFWSDAIDDLAELAGETAEDQTWQTREFWLRDADANTFRFGQRLN